MCAIIAIVSAVLWAALGGRSKLAAKQTQIKADMRGVVVAVNLYRNDHDDGLPASWTEFGYYAVNRKGQFGDGYPLVDTTYDKPLEYDVSYHTPECAQPPKEGVSMYAFRQMVSRFNAAPRYNKMDLEHGQAMRFGPACLPNSFSVRELPFLRNGELKIARRREPRSLAIDLSGTLSYQYGPAWTHEIALGY